MSSRRFTFALLGTGIAACAGVAFAVPQPKPQPHPLPATRPAQAPTPSAVEERSEPAPTPTSNGHHAASGPIAVVEHHEIHSSGSVGVVSGTVSSGTSSHGTVTPPPSAAAPATQP